MKFLTLFVSFVWVLTNTNSMEIGSRIINGKEAEDDAKFNFEVGIYITRNDQSTIFCSGSIVDPKWILTAGSCLENALSAVVRAGSKSLTASTYYNSTNKFIFHTNYSSELWSHNLGLVPLEKSIDNKIGETVNFLEKSSHFDTTFNAIVTGWGQTTTDDEYSRSDILLYIEVETIENTVCNQYYDLTYINDQVVCTNFDTNPQKNPCYGDAGAPLLFTDSSEMKLAGILNFFNGYRCDYPYPAVYTKIDKSHQDWITTATG